MYGRCSGEMRSGEESTERVRSGAFSCRRRESRSRGEAQGED